ncbi:epoxide hydrolase [Nonomuraea ferruginea]
MEYWAGAYDWRAQEAKLNRFPQFTTEIDGQTVHFFHVRCADPGALPLVITHSWPNSIVEFTELLGPLSETFHVIAPSLPGFGFSPFPEPADERPWSVERVARTWAELMGGLGYERYGVHGNDAGGRWSRRGSPRWPRSGWSGCTSPAASACRPGIRPSWRGCRRRIGRWSSTWPGC